MIRTAIRRPRVAKGPTSITKTVPFPVGGWDALSPLASMPADRAVQLTNWVPQPGYGEIRRGCTRHAWDVGSDTDSVETLMAWRGPAAEKMFAASGGAIYDVTANAPATSAVTGLTSDRWQAVNFSNSGGHYLWICNGSDDCRHYNGTTWATPSITNVTSSDIVNVNIHKKRIWLVENDSTSVWYLATDAIAGAATEFPMGGLFSRGGYLMAMGTWTRDGGNGSDDYAAFISSEGQIALYQGTDPSSANTWALVGVFDCPPPIGRRCFFKYGADLALLTTQGVFQLSKLMSVDQSQASGVALSENIGPAFSRAARSYRDNFGWEAVTYPKGTRLIVNVPSVEGTTAAQYCMNTLTGAWFDISGWNANCFIVFAERLYFGDNLGRVMLADNSAMDYDTPITAVGQTAYGALGTPKIKHWRMVRPLLLTSGTYRPDVGISTEFQETSTLSSSAGSLSSSAALFGSAVFGTATFGADTNQSSDWIGLAGIGTFGSLKFRGRSGVDDASAVDTWGTGLWGTATWGISTATEETLQVNGFLVMAEVGGMV